MTEYRSYRTNDGIRVEIVRSDDNESSRLNDTTPIQDAVFYSTTTALAIWALIIIL